MSWVKGNIEWEPTTLREEICVTQTRKLSKDADEEDLAQTDVLNSFFLDELAHLKGRVDADDYGEAFARYLRLRPSETPVDVRQNQVRLKAALSPDRAPTGRWPSRGMHQLALMQQAAVNEILAGAESATAPAGLFSVNGPPGTGTTTLLRDVIAGLLIERARRMCGFERPDEAFGDAPAHVTVGDKDWPVYPIDASLLGFEIVVASSNNNAVENITEEIPSVGAIENAALSGLDLFQTVASDLLGGPDADGRETAWGLISAVLGNKENRSDFTRDLWHSKSKQRPSLRPRLERAEHTDGMSAWRTAREAFTAADGDLQARRRKLAELEQAWLAEPSWTVRTVQEFVDRLFVISAVQRLDRRRKRLDRQFDGLLTELGEQFPYGAFDRLPRDQKTMTQPWITAEHDRQRADLFVKALAVHKAFLEASTKRLLPNLRRAIDLIGGQLDPGHAAGQNDQAPIAGVMVIVMIGTAISVILAITLPSDLVKNTIHDGSPVLSVLVDTLSPAVTLVGFVALIWQSGREL